mmetsp:Transcript_348/g.722  ORF Transcript_348/g.722 Transcript_348/m.722 type:complete len:441 (+) Transcript_348:56-1378(+)|eukprot:CAMPEP_0171330498 /NCGR_PEP_ID=MMETSP0878-20121228/2042_1 /TAXON_ID=67004 /ORGANISM="Thalassiosira weissflogii, Strain CCMP1336" /LENGTH=440 /DNA_ID=CAMNT_0011830805 /DNA_START=48 /DNA_END=1370 /DNA_ORIENTATION=-
MVAIPSHWLLATTTLLFPTLTTSFTAPFLMNPSNPNSKPTPTSLFSTTVPPSSTSTTSTPIEYDIVRVDLANGRDYPIYIGSSFPSSQSTSLLRRHVHGKRVLLITNDRISPLYLEAYRAMLADDEGAADGKELVVDTLVLPDGEENKTLEVMNLILDRALELGLDRKSTFVALGGGVIGDMVGFASAIYQRGVNFIQIPTTVMAMVDSSVGGKTGVNHPLGKNMIGSFHQPQCVFIDTQTLSTLPDRELQSGISEIVKYGLIRDAPFFSWQESNMSKLLGRDPEATRYAIKRSCENKAEVVQEDEKEAGVRATLNLGHTFGHAIENGSGYGTFLHGEGVSIGMCMAAKMSEKMGWIEGELRERIYGILEEANLPVRLPKDSPMTVETFQRLMSLDKKVADGKLRLILLRGELGNCFFTGDFDVDALQETIEEFVKEISA